MYFLIHEGQNGNFVAYNIKKNIMAGAKAAFHQSFPLHWIIPMSIHFFPMSKKIFDLFQPLVNTLFYFPS